jgi:hypothetical protein
LHRRFVRSEDRLRDKGQIAEPRPARGAEQDHGYENPTGRDLMELPIRLTRVFIVPHNAPHQPEFGGDARVVRRNSTVRIHAIAAALRS